MFGCDPAPYSVQGLLQTLGLHRLGQIVDGLEIKGADGMLLERRDENGGRQTQQPHLFDDFEPAETRHLHIEKEKIDLMLLKICDRFVSVAAFRDYVDVRLLAKQHAESLARQRLIIDQERAQAHAVATSYGISIMTS